MALRLIVILGLIFSALAAPTDPPQFQSNSGEILGNEATQGTKGSIHIKDGSQSSTTGLGGGQKGASGRSDVSRRRSIFNKSGGEVELLARRKAFIIELIKAIMAVGFGSEKRILDSSVREAAPVSSAPAGSGGSKSID